MEEVQPIKQTSMVIVSPAAGALAPQELLPQDWRAIGKKALQSFYGLALMYVGPVAYSITNAVADGSFVLSASYFIPNQIMIGGMILFVISRLKDYLVYATKETTYKVE